MTYDLDTAESVLRFSLAHHTIALAPPAIEIDQEQVPLTFAGPPSSESQELPNGVIATIFTGQVTHQPGLHLTLEVRQAPGSEVARFRYTLWSGASRRLTKANGADAFTYASFDVSPRQTVTEVRFSEYERMLHTYRLVEVPVRAEMFAHAQAVMGPMLVVEGDGFAGLIAYEHGSTVPDAFVRFALSPERRIRLQAVKGNYHDGHDLALAPFTTIWCEVGMASDATTLADAYRGFVLHELSQNLASRRPYIYYNTWARQERDHWWDGNPYLHTMVQQEMLDDIDRAHEMGIDVFVLDTGWYSKTGDWRVNLQRFPDGLAAIRRKLDAYGMKLGLWFSPTEAAVSSRIATERPDCRMSWHGKRHDPHVVWETEASYNMCLVSDYWETFADELIRLVHEVGVTYFKWDAVGQWGCSDPHHHHGTTDNSADERACCYAFQQVRYMARIIDKLCTACPEAIVDFDVTERGRSVGLAFLASGKYFLINNGPYFHDFDHPKDGPAADKWSNVYVYPGPTRPRNCREALGLDKWLPSIFFLTHYLPDAPASSQYTNLASLILGHNGIWGDLTALSPEGIANHATVLAAYKQVRDAITNATPRVTGAIGGTPEIHEKLDDDGRGAISIFAGAPGTYIGISQRPVHPSYWTMPDLTVELLPDGLAKLTLTLQEPGGRAAFFGAT